MTDVQAEIAAVLQTYFHGLFHGDVAALRRVFHPAAQLFGEVRAQPYHRTLDDYLQIVAGRESPQARGETFRMLPLSIEVTGAIACAKVHCPMLGYEYIDYLSLVRSEGHWRIVNKTFTDIQS